MIPRCRARLLLACLAAAAAAAPSVASAGTVIAPPWVNVALNPCSASSWQLVHWPADGRCYPIFQQGPCSPTQELTWDRVAGQPVCVCPDGHLLHAPNGRCYRRHARGPCPRRHYLVEDVATSAPTCRRQGRCPPGELFWPAEGRCHRYLSRGPCGKGELLTFSRATHEPVCGCSRRYMARTYWPHTDSCYQQMTRGPCPHGLVFFYNSTRRLAECGCHAGLRENYDRRSGQCYPQGERGPCPPGNVFAFNNVTGSTECRCPADSLVLPDTGACHRAFAQGPCKRNRFVAPRPEAPHQGVCVANPCRRGELYFPADQYCHRIGRRGPCPAGQLVQYEEFRGISYRGACGCTKHFTQNFWPADGRCYEQQTRGPCPPRELFAYNATSGRTECACSPELGRTAAGQCAEPFSRSGCPAGQVLLPASPGELRCGCPAGQRPEPERGRCLPLQSETFKGLELLRVVR